MQSLFFTKFSSLALEFRRVLVHIRPVPVEIPAKLNRVIGFFTVLAHIKAQLFFAPIDSHGHEQLHHFNDNAAHDGNKDDRAKRRCQLDQEHMPTATIEKAIFWQTAVDSFGRKQSG